MVPMKPELYISVPTVVHIKVLKVRYLYDFKTVCYTELGSDLVLNDT